MLNRLLLRGLTLAELEACACLWTTRLLALHSAGVAGEEALILECFLVLSVDLHQCAGDGKPQSLALTGEATSVEVDLDIIFVCNIEQLERLLDNILKDG